MVVAEKMRSAVASLVIPIQDDEGLQVTVSIGTATSREGVASAELLTHSDQALYSAKRSGKNRVHLHGV